MTTEEFAAQFPPGNCRPSRWKPGYAADYTAAKRASFAASRRADDLFVTVMCGDKPAEHTAAVCQAVAWLDRLAWAEIREAARLWEEGAA